MGSELAEIKRRQEERFYQNWLERRNVPHTEDTVATLSPREVMQHMGNMVLVDEQGAIPVMERVVAKMYSLALNGDKTMLNKVYDELEHHGVQKVEHTIKEEQITPAQWAILEQAGFVDAEYTIVEAQEATEQQNDPSSTYPTLDPQETFSEDFFGNDEDF